MTISGKLHFLIISTSASASLDYYDGAIQSVAAEVGVKVDWYVGSLEGSVAVAYSKGDADISVTLSGKITVGFWKFKHSWSMSKTLTIDASFLVSDEPAPQPVQQISVPVNSTPNTWEYTSQMFLETMGSSPSGFSYAQMGWAGLDANDVDVMEAVYGVDELNGYSRQQDEVTITPTSGQTQLGSDPYDASSTYDTISVTVQPGISPMGRAIMAPGGVTDGCSDYSFNLDVQIPKVPNPTPGNCLSSQPFGDPTFPYTPVSTASGT